MRDARHALVAEPVAFARHRHCVRLRLGPQRTRLGADPDRSGTLPSR